MPRNSSGTMTLPSPGVPFQSGTTISSANMNATLADLATEVTSSLDRTGRGGMTAPLRSADGTVAAPAYSFTSEVGSGIYRAAAGDVRLAVGGVDALKLAAGGIADGITLVSGQTGIVVTLVGGNALIQGNLGATQAGTPADVVVNSTATRTAGNIFKVQNHLADQLFVTYQGLLQLANQAAAIQPASLWTAITPGANWTAGSGLAYWKDASGTVHLKGTLVPAAGASSFTVFTLPVGFRPAASRFFTITDNTATGQGSVDTTGVFAINSVLTTGHTYAVDGVTFLAEA